MIANNDFDSVVLPGVGAVPSAPPIGALPSTVSGISSAAIGGTSVGGQSSNSGLAAATAAANALLGGPTVHEAHQWDSFSGRDLDCGADAGPVHAFVKQLPPKLQGAVSVPNTVTALVVVSSADFKQAMAMQQNLAVRDAVDTCCRLPFLRHTPLGEVCNGASCRGPLHLAICPITINIMGRGSKLAHLDGYLWMYSKSCTCRSCISWPSTWRPCALLAVRQS